MARRRRRVKPLGHITANIYRIFGNVIQEFVDDAHIADTRRNDYMMEAAQHKIMGVERIASRLGVSCHCILPDDYSKRFCACDRTQQLARAKVEEKLKSLGYRYVNGRWG